MTHIEVTYLESGEGKPIKIVTVTHESFPVVSRRLMRAGLTQNDGSIVTPGAIIRIKEKRP
jgi:hypothetical protein